MAQTFVVPDCHANMQLPAKLLQQEGLLDDDLGRINPEITVVQLGDLIHSTSRSNLDDKYLLGMAKGWFDIYLVGNHELPHFTGGGPASFDGYWPDREIQNILHRFRSEDFLRAAHASDDVLITHAGVGTYYRKGLHNPDDPQEIADELNARWRGNVLDPIFTKLGKARGGSQNQGGILWADWSEPKPKTLRQLVGHTVGDTVRHHAGATCIDLGVGKGDYGIAGAWIRDGEIQTVLYRDKK